MFVAKRDINPFTLSFPKEKLLEVDDDDNDDDDDYELFLWYG